MSEGCELWSETDRFLRVVQQKPQNDKHAGRCYRCDPLGHVCQYALGADLALSCLASLLELQDVAALGSETSGPNPYSGVIFVTTEMTTEQMEAWMRRALELAIESVSAGNHPFGAVIVLNGDIVVEAQNTIHTESDVTRHAEMNAISLACQTLSEEQFADCILVTSTEPCAMCSGALYWAGIKTVVYGCPANQLDKVAGAALSCHSHDVFEGAVNPPAVYGPVLEALAVEQHRVYWLNLD